MLLVLISGDYYLVSETKFSSHKKGDWVYEEDNNVPIYQFSYDIEDYPLQRVIACSKSLTNFKRKTLQIINKSTMFPIE